MIDLLQRQLDGRLIPEVYTALDTIASAQGKLLGAEEQIIARANNKRRQEFVAGRTLARRALQRIGYGATDIFAKDRIPIWPPSIVGSISHCKTHAIAAVAPRCKVLSLGIDVEENQAIPPDTIDMICHAEELGNSIDACYTATLVFSAKEAVFKAVSTTLPYIDFHDVRLQFSSASRSFLAQIRNGPSLHGSYFIDRVLIVTTTFIRAS